jgi:hypothetical protein
LEYINISILKSISIKTKGLVHAMGSDGPLHQVRFQIGLLS